MKQTKQKTQQKKSYCIVCAMEKDGIPIREDRVIKTIRFIKKNVFKTEKKNRIVVCKECYEKYKKYRKSYMRRQALYVALGVLFLILLLLISQTIQAVTTGLAMILVLYLLSLLNYTPELDVSAVKSGAQRI